MNHTFRKGIMPNSTPTFEEAYEQASSSLPDEKTESQPTAEPAVEQPAQVSTPAVEPQVDAEQKPEDDFLKNPDSMPDELKPTMEKIKKDWQSAYTKKRQAEKAEIDALKKQIETLQAQQGQTQPQGQLTADQLIEAKVQEVNENAYISAQEKAFLNLDPRFNEDSPEFDRRLYVSIQDSLTQAREKWEKENGTVLGFDFVGEAKKELQEWDNYLQTKNKAYIAAQDQMIKAQADKSKKVNAGATNVKVDKPISSFEDAFEEAYRQQVG